MAENMSDIVSHMCGYCNKIFEGEHELDKHIEDIHFLEVLNEEDDEDGEDDAMETVDGDINVSKVYKASEEDEVLDNVDVDMNVENMNEEYEVVDPVESNFDSEEKLDINVKKENFSGNSEPNNQEELKQEKVTKQTTAKNLSNKERLLENINIKSETTKEIEENQIANAEMKKLRKREKDRLKKQRLRQRQRESGDIKIIRENDRIKKQRRRQLISGHIDVKKPRNPKRFPKERSSLHRDWSPFYRREEGSMRCLACLAEFGGLRQVKI